MIDLKNIRITPEMLNIITEVDEFKGSWNASEHQPDKYKHLKKIATIESIGSSNRIEGNTLTDKQVETVLANLKRQSFTSRDEQEVAGYAELMEDIFENYEVIPFNENYIKQLHKILLSYSDKDERHRGEYKTLANSVAAFDADGKEIGIVFETATPFDTPQLMRELVQETREQLEDKFIHPLIMIGLFVVHFLAIHPFQDGNGRMSRALTTLLLLKNGYSYVPYSSMEGIIEENKASYYKALRNSQKTFKTDDVNYDYWLNFFLRTVQKQVLRLKQKMNQTATGLTLTENKIMDLFDEQKQWTTSEMAKTLNMNTATLKKAVGELVKKGYLIKNGTTRGAWYERK
ncbi:MAG: Fic family protein [Alphaproteobacteria bacterium]|nr:Fic family protein [Alphaproteobacteria bacterium]